MKLQADDNKLIEFPRDHDVITVCQAARTVADGREGKLHDAMSYELLSVRDR